MAGSEETCPGTSSLRVFFIVFSLHGSRPTQCVFQHVSAVDEIGRTHFSTESDVFCCPFIFGVVIVIVKQALLHMARPKRRQKSHYDP